MSRQVLLIASLGLCFALGACGDGEAPEKRQAHTTCGEYLDLSEGEKAELVRDSADPPAGSGGIAYVVDGFTRACESEDPDVTLLDVLVPPE